LCNPTVKTADRTDRGIRKWGNHFPEVKQANTDVAITLHQKVVLRLVCEQNQVIHFAIGSDLPGTREEANPTMWKFFHQPFDQGDGRVGRIIHAKKNLILWIVLIAEAGKVFVRGKVHAADRLQ
jgi:hypothetical protein